MYALSFNHYTHTHARTHTHTHTHIHTHTYTHTHTHTHTHILHASQVEEVNRSYILTQLIGYSLASSYSVAIDPKPPDVTEALVVELSGPIPRLL